MKQPHLDLFNWDAAGPTGDYETWLCTAPKTEGRLGFVSKSRDDGSSSFFFTCLTPYGLHCRESDFIKVLRDFEVFNMEYVKALAETPLPDACVANILMNALRMWTEDFEEGEPHQFKLVYSCYSGVGRFHNPDIPGTYWGIGHDRWMIEVKGNYFSVSETVVNLLATTKRLTEVPVTEMFMVREGNEDELKYWPHPAAVDRFGRRLCTLTGDYIPRYATVQD